MVTTFIVDPKSFGVYKIGLHNNFSLRSMEKHILKDIRFACSLEFKELPRYSNSGTFVVRKIVLDRLKGKVISIEPYVNFIEDHDPILGSVFVCGF